MERIEEVKENKLKKFMFLRLGTSVFALPLSAVREVLGLGQLTPLPNMPPYFAGLVNLRGKIVSAVDLKKSLNFLNTGDRDANSKRPCVVISEVNGRLYGAITDDVVEVAAVPEKDIEPVEERDNNKDVLSGIIKRNVNGISLAPVLIIEKALKLEELIPIAANYEK